MIDKDKLEEIKREFGDCDFLRAILNEYTTESVLWLIRTAENAAASQDKLLAWIEAEEALANQEVDDGYYRQGIDRELNRLRLAIKSGEFEVD